MRLLMFPTWLLVVLAKPIMPKDHPWKQVRPTLTQWSEGATDLCVGFSIVFWSFAMGMLADFVIWGWR